jgi:hypothetical protein
MSSVDSVEDISRIKHRHWQSSIPGVQAGISGRECYLLKASFSGSVHMKEAKERDLVADMDMDEGDK